MSDEILNRFEKRGRAAGFLLNCGNPESTASAERRISQALAIYRDHPELQERMHTIALSFAWSFIARLEQDAFLHQSCAQRAGYR